MNIQAAGPNFTGYHFTTVDKLSKDTQKLVDDGVNVIKTASSELQSIKTKGIDKGGYRLSGRNQSNDVRAELSAVTADKKKILLNQITNDGFTLSVEKGETYDDIKVVAGNIEYESSKHPLRYNQYEPLEGGLLKEVDNLLKTYLPIFFKK